MTPGFWDSSRFSIFSQEIRTARTAQRLSLISRDGGNLYRDALSSILEHSSRHRLVCHSTRLVQWLKLSIHPNRKNFRPASDPGQVNQCRYSDFSTGFRSLGEDRVAIEILNYTFVDLLGNTNTNGSSKFRNRLVSGEGFGPCRTIAFSRILSLLTHKWSNDGAGCSKN
jgi:hypothetical protein